jgi:hypothetical protein
MIHDIPQYPKGCPLSGFFSGPASWLITPTSSLRTITSGTNNGFYSNQKTFPQLLICLEVAGLHSIRITYIAKHSPQERRHPKLSKKRVALTGTWSKLMAGSSASSGLASCLLGVCHL